MLRQHAVARIRLLHRHFARTPSHRLPWGATPSCASAPSAVCTRDVVAPLLTVRQCSSSTPPPSVTIGDVTVPVTPPDQPQLVPRGHLPRELPQDTLAHLRWLMQTELLGQDVLLVGPPGHRCRALVLQFAELLQREVEIVTVSEDTTEADLKQRRELLGGTATFVDQAPVRAALSGALLFVDGLERAERNVLPSLNNLLEAREMTLDDGRTLVAAKRFDAMAAEVGADELRRRGIERVSPSFRVIATALPSPPYPGYPLDPPLRSRFAARHIAPPAVGDLVSSVGTDAVGTGLTTLAATMTALEDMHEAMAVGGRLPHFQPELVADVAQHVAAFPRFPKDRVAELVHRRYPFTALRSPSAHGEHVASVAAALTKSGFPWPPPPAPPPQAPQQPAGVSDRYVGVASQATVVQALVEEHALGRHVCVLGGKGSGKSAVAQQFASRVGVEPVLFPLFQELSARDLLQRRSSSHTGDTSWVHSPLVHAAVAGRVCILDGLDQVSASTLASLSLFLKFGYATLPDGTRLVPPGMPAADGVIPVHPDFRVVALAAPPGAADVEPWLHPELLGCFSFLPVPQLPPTEQQQLLTALFPAAPPAAVRTVMELADAVRVEATAQLADQPGVHHSLTLSLRQLIRVVRHAAAAAAAAGPSAVADSAALPPAVQHAVAQSVREVLLEPFLPDAARAVVASALRHVGLSDTASAAAAVGGAAAVALPPPRVEDGALVIGDVRVPVAKHVEHAALVPDPLFFDTPSHTALLHDLLVDLNAGERHLLLLGNQGTGKNKLTDRLLHLLRREREYTQLHRDSTVQSLTELPTVVDGRVEWTESPLVKAARHGRVLVVDEADKAPVEVVRVLKSLVEDGEMRLASGRRLVRRAPAVPDPDAIVVHPEFAMVVLANRAGFPFLGNAFFHHCGDVFSSHVVNSLDLASEANMLRSYGPSVGDTAIQQLTAAFAELRELNVAGVLAYPYSTRETVAVVTHLEAFPADGLVPTLESVLALDSFDARLRAMVAEVFQRHGIPVPAQQPTGRTPISVELAQPVPLPDPRRAATWRVASDARRTTLATSPWVPGGGDGMASAARLTPHPDDVAVQPGRLRVFNELKAQLQLFPASKRRTPQRVVASTATADGAVHAVTRMPFMLHSVSGLGGGAAGAHAQHSVIDMREAMLPRSMGGLQPSRHGGGMWRAGSSMHEGRVALTAVPDDPALRVAMVVPQLGCVLVVQPWSGATSLVGLPADGVRGGDAAAEAEGMAASMTRMVPSVFKAGGSAATVYHPSARAATDGGAVDMRAWHVTPAANGVVVAWREGDGGVAVVDCLAGRSAVLPLPTASRLLTVERAGAPLAAVPDAPTAVTMLVRSDTGAPGVLHLNTAGGDGVTGWWADVEVDRSAASSADGAHSSVPIAYGASPPPHLGADALARALVSSSSHMDTLVATGTPGEVSVFETPRAGAGAGAGAGAAAAGDVTPTVTSAVAATMGRTHLTAALATADGDDVVEVVQGDAVRSLPLPGGSGAVVGVHALSATGGDVAVVTATGSVGVVQADGAALKGELAEWRRMMGVQEGAPLTVTTSAEVASVEASKAPPPLDTPKHGEEDDAPHVGGSNYAGGTGGSNTAGLGGVGGPYRLDKGHTVHQVSEEVKATVSEEARAKAKAMADEALAQRLRDIQLSSSDFAQYTGILGRVRQEIAQLRVVLEAADTRSHERVWLKAQTSGELDDRRLVDAVAGEQAVYKRRGQPEADPHATQLHPHKVEIVVDVSGSMYRFNGQDGRLNRELEVVTLLMESLAGMPRFDYSLVGHSGDTERVPLVDFGSPPVDARQRLSVLETMVAHSQFCLSGDHTLQALQTSMDTLATLPPGTYQDRYVFLISDANLRRYGIPPSHLAKVLQSHADVHAYCIFIAGLGDEAELTVAELPAGQAFVCKNTAELPALFRKIFTTQFGV